MCGVLSRSSGVEQGWWRLGRGTKVTSRMLVMFLNGMLIIQVGSVVKIYTAVHLYVCFAICMLHFNKRFKK